MIKHGMAIGKRHGLYLRYYHMKARCYNPNCKAYKNYGGRGIRICDEWLEDFMNFYNWAIENGYQDNLTIDRIDNNGNYEPSNCRWITDYEQRFNKRNNKILTIERETKTITEWAKLYNLNIHTIYSRIRYGWKGKDLLKPKTIGYEYLKGRPRNKLGQFTSVTEEIS